MEIILPKWGVTMQEATLTRWLVKVGDTVTEGQPVASVETDKVDGDIESPIAGVIVSISVKEGETVAVGTVVGEIEG